MGAMAQMQSCARSLPGEAMLSNAFRPIATLTEDQADLCLGTRCSGPTGYDPIRHAANAI